MFQCLKAYIITISKVLASRRLQPSFSCSNVKLSRLLYSLQPQTSQDECRIATNEDGMVSRIDLLNIIFRQASPYSDELGGELKLLPEAPRVRGIGDRLTLVDRLITMYGGGKGDIIFAK